MTEELVNYRAEVVKTHSVKLRLTEVRAASVVCSCRRGGVPAGRSVALVDAETLNGVTPPPPVAAPPRSGTPRTLLRI